MQHLEAEDLVARDDEIADAGFAIVVREQRPATCLDGVGDPVGCNAESAGTLNIFLEGDGQGVHLVPWIRDCG